MSFAGLSPAALDGAAEALSSAPRLRASLGWGGTRAMLILIRQGLPLRVSAHTAQQGPEINPHGEEADNDAFTG